MNTAAVMLDAPVMCRFHVGDRDTANDPNDWKCSNPGADCYKIKLCFHILQFNKAALMCHNPSRSFSDQSCYVFLFFVLLPASLFYFIIFDSVGWLIVPVC